MNTYQPPAERCYVLSRVCERLSASTTGLQWCAYRHDEDASFDAGWIYLNPFASLAELAQAIAEAILPHGIAIDDETAERLAIQVQKTQLHRVSAE